MLRGFQWSSLPPSSITVTVSNPLKHFVPKFLTPVNNELTQVAHILRSPFLSWLVLGCKYQNTQLETVEAKQKSKSPGIRRYSESFIGDPAPSSVMSKVPSALVLQDFHLRLEADMPEGLLAFTSTHKAIWKMMKIRLFISPFRVCMCVFVFPCVC